MALNKIVSLALVLVCCFLSCYGVLAANNICCMPKAHTVHAKITRVNLDNCDANGNCKFNGKNVVIEKHMPDFYHDRYRLDLTTLKNDVVTSKQSTVGFVTDKVTMSQGFEYVFNETSCTCHKLTSKPPYLMVSCVTDDFTLDSTITIGLAQKAQKYVRTNNYAGHDEREVRVAQPIRKVDGVNECFIAFWTEETMDKDARGNVKAMSSMMIETWDFLPYNTDEDYLVPSYCPKATSCN
ncbi:hypothetical protein ABK040_008421 [Willaertia magna]